MKLSKDEQRVISYVHTQATTPPKAIANALGLREHRVRYIINKLERLGVLHPVALLNLALVGFSEYAVYCSIQGASERTRRQVLQKLLAEENIPWMAELGGNLGLAFAFRARDILDLQEYLRALGEEFGIVLLNTSIHLRTAILFPPYQFSDETVACDTNLKITHERPKYTADEKDIAIMHELETDASVSHRAIAHKLGLAQSTVSARIKKLEQNGIIAGYMHGITFSLLNYHMFELFLYVNRLDEETRRRIHAVARSMPYVMHSLDGIGNWQFEIGVAVPRAALVRGIVDKLYAAFPGVLTDINVVPFLAYHKVSLRNVSDPRES